MLICSSQNSSLIWLIALICFQAANELIREIATLELEVKNMEQYLLTLYRKAFEQQAPAFSPPDNREASKPSLSSRSGQLWEMPMAIKSFKSREDTALRSSYPLPHKKWNDPLTTSVRPDRAVDSDVLRCQSALSYRGVCSSRIQPSDDDSLARALRSCHSQPFSFLEVMVCPMINILGVTNYSLLN